MELVIDHAHMRKLPSAITTEEITFPLGRVLEPCVRDRVKDQILEQSVFFSLQEL